MAEFLTHMRQIRFRPASRLKGDHNRLDILLLCVGNQPMNRHAVIFLDKNVFLAADGVVPLLIRKKLMK